MRLLLFSLLSVSCSSPSSLSPFLHTANYSGEGHVHAEGSRFVAATQSGPVSEIAKEIYHQGGNAVDAAVAASFGISVARQQSTGLGGGGFMLLKLADKKELIAVDFREMAPGRAYEKMYQDEQGRVVKRRSTDGALSVAVPGTVAGLLEIHERYGKLSRQKVIAPAIRLAEEGVLVGTHLERALRYREKVLRSFPASKAIFFKGERLLRKGDRLVQKDLGKVLREISQNGRNGFYRGWVASAIARGIQEQGGWITMKDLRNYQVKFRKPLTIRFRGYDVVSMPPPSSGGVHVLQIFNILSKDPLEKWGPHDSRMVHLYSAASQQAFADRAKYLGDPDFEEVPTKRLISSAYGRKLRQKIDPNRATPSSKVFAGNPYQGDSDDTTHFSLMDGEGNLVVSTQTINGPMGSAYVPPGTGVLMNNEMDDFSIKPGVPNLYGAIGGMKNAIQAGKRPLSSMSPTIVLKGGIPVLGVGSPNGTRIITCTAQTILNYLVHGQSLEQAVATTRYHHQWYPDEIRLEAEGLPAATIASLHRMGWKTKVQPFPCRVQAVAKRGNRLEAVSDPRGEGVSVGLN